MTGSTPCCSVCLFFIVFTVSLHFSLKQTDVLQLQNPGVFAQHPRAETRPVVTYVLKTKELFQELFSRLRAPEAEEDCYHPACRLLQI